MTQLAQPEKIIMDNYYVAPSSSREPDRSKELDRFVLLEINYKKGDLI